ncbi:hypothetical protein M409DRAFT_50531 [Zasmidium cellare ATCC 36951]|uniref:Uncharacterized protein n=1 Tax=Zasmidium cellare ATCC 36951 TaxID=1080233 RepID=A0A6A6D1F7_ZASCE|nr:uncharacterized protein M409DRAFT_50531 [Zasmidium cellare ATCC 36951]KAF2171919.1 hypothetical protein M409DRAFT_50531 [Zasmidium cellare ATCC 36951]
MAAPSPSDGIHFRLDLLLTSNLAARMPPQAAKRQHRPTRNVKARPRPRVLLPNHQLVIQPPPSRDDDFETAASTDSSSNSLSEEIKEMQDHARIAAYDQYRQKSDHESLRHLAAVTRAEHEYAVRLDRLSLAVLEYATAPKPKLNFDDILSDIDDDEHYTPQTMTTSELEAFDALNPTSSHRITSSQAAHSDGATGSYVLVDSQPTLSSDGILGSVPRYAPAAQMSFVMPTLSYGNDGNSSPIASSGHPLARIEEESTGSFSDPSQPPEMSIKFSPTNDENLQQDSLHSRLQNLEDQDSKDAVTQSWLEEQIAEAMGNDILVRDDGSRKTDEAMANEMLLRDSGSRKIEELMDSVGDKWSQFQKELMQIESRVLDLEFINKEDEDLPEENGHENSDEGDDEDYVLVCKEEANEDWFEVATESMVKSMD